jgi:hypothetical protein
VSGGINGGFLCNIQDRDRIAVDSVKDPEVAISLQEVDSFLESWKLIGTIPDILVGVQLAQSVEPGAHGPNIVVIHSPQSDVYGGSRDNLVHTEYPGRGSEIQSLR